jgi:hypothetical protein
MPTPAIRAHALDNEILVEVESLCRQQLARNITDNLNAPTGILDDAEML